MRWNLLAGFAVGCTWLFSPPPARACSCDWIGPPCQAAWNADAIFSGVVRSVEAIDERESGPTRVTFDVHRPFVGGEASRLEVLTARHGAACGIPFAVGTAYLVYAKRSETGELTTSRCSRTRPLVKAEDDLRFLENLPRDSTGARVFGDVRHWQREAWERAALDYGPLADLVVSVTGPGWYRETTTDVGGRYELRGLPTGTISIAVAAPPGFDQRFLERSAELPDPRACVEENFELSLWSAASGRVVDASGSPVEGVAIDAVAAELAAHRPQAYQPPARSDAEGRFTFEGLPPGRYVFGVRLTERHLKSTGAPVFLPGTDTVREARVLELAAGETTDVGTIRLPAQ